MRALTHLVNARQAPERAEPFTLKQYFCTTHKLCLSRNGSAAALPLPSIHASTDACTGEVAITARKFLMGPRWQVRLTVLHVSVVA